MLDDNAKYADAVSVAGAVAVVEAPSLDAPHADIAINTSAPRAVDRARFQTEANSTDIQISLFTIHPAMDLLLSPEPVPRGVRNGSHFDTKFDISSQ
jgi:hypothetical protein